MNFNQAQVLFWILGGFNNENVFQFKGGKNNKISSFKCNCNKEQSCNSFYTGGKSVSFRFHLNPYLTPNFYDSKLFLNLLLRFQLVVQLQHAMLIMKSQMHGVNMVHTILAKTTEIINQSNSVMFSKSKYQQNIGLEMDSQLWFDGEIFKVHPSSSGMPTFSIFTERTVESMFWSILDHMMLTGIELEFMNSFLSPIDWQSTHFVSIFF